MKYFTKINLPLLVVYNIFCIFLLIYVEKSVGVSIDNALNNKEFIDFQNTPNSTITNETDVASDSDTDDKDVKGNSSTITSVSEPFNNGTTTEQPTETTTNLTTNSPTSTTVSTTTEIVSTSSSETSTEKTLSSTGSTLLPTAAPSSTRRFDAPSFIGGIVLSLGFLAIMYVGFKFYKARTESNYHTL
ncbi:porimin-like [Limulus polyphemus]|uniref:Porimin-like n=1 Tax=Limulus polyphemus TaxID=6850 RepID=A0ABM1C0Z2_LIMPO|nr:porimin-like [Limulus polyphemus]